MRDRKKIDDSEKKDQIINADMIEKYKKLAENIKTDRETMKKYERNLLKENSS